MIKSAIIICYNPDIEKLEKLCKSILIQDTNIILINNGENLVLSPDINDLLTIKNLNSNYGLAYAQNLGVSIARNEKADFVLFFDQDSVIPENFIENLIAPLNISIANVSSPLFYDEENGFEFPTYKINNWGLPKEKWSSGSNKPYLTDLIISSGTAVTIVTFDIVGLFDEDFFIDFVDLEWAFRCKRERIPIFVVPSAVMRHSIGIKSLNLGFIRIFVHSAERSYYKLRNSFLLFRKTSIPKAFATKELISALTHQFLTLFIIRFKTKYVTMFITAIAHGVIGKKGKRIAK